jgi:SAM-dependent methyltransferase
MPAPAAASTYHATDGAAYEVFLGRWTRRLAQPLLDFAEFPEDGPLLDAGCGTGSLAHAMATRWPRREVIGVGERAEHRVERDAMAARDDEVGRMRFADQRDFRMGAGFNGGAQRIDRQEPVGLRERGDRARTLGRGKCDRSILAGDESHKNKLFASGESPARARITGATNA